MVQKPEGNSLIKAAVTDEDGKFIIIDIPPQEVILQIEYLGLETYRSETIPLMAGDEKVLPPIAMESAAAELSEAVVTATRPLIEVEADKTVFNVENTINSTGSNGWELLRKAPGVIVDNNNNLIVDGKSGTQIFIDGKPSPLRGDDLINYLQTLQSTDIRSIEIITQPSARYDAAGTAGIINIRLKKEKGLGTNGTLAAGYSYGQNSRYNSSLSLNHRSRASQLFGTYSNSFGKTWTFLYLDRFQNNVRYNSESESLMDNRSHNVRLGYDLFSSDKHTLGWLVNANLFDGTTNTFSETPITPLATGEITQTLIADNRSNRDNYNLQANMNYRYRDTTGHELSADLDYGRYQRDEFRFQPNRYYQGAYSPNGNNDLIFERNFQMTTPTNIDILAAQVDYQQKLWGGTISTGGKLSYVRTENIFDFFDLVEEDAMLNEERSNQFFYTEQINAGYVSYNRSWGKWKLQLGLRAEQTISEGDLRSTQQSVDNNVRRRYTNLFPSGGLTFQPAPKSSWAVSYSRRITRPNYQSLNPFESQLDELTYTKGNPFLQPQYTDNWKLSHTYNYRLTTSVSYSNTQDFFAQITDTLGSDRNFLTPLNIADQSTWSIGLSYPFQVADWWSVYVNATAYRASYSANDAKFNPVERSTFSLYAQNTVNLPAGLRLEVSGWFSSPSIWGGTYLSKSMGSLNLGLQRNWLDDRLTVRLTVSDVFFTSPWRADMRFGELYINGTGGWESRQLSLNASFAFGNKEVKQKRSIRRSIEDEEGRIE